MKHMTFYETIELNIGIIDEYNMDNYDDDKDGDIEDVNKLINFGDLAVYADPRDDPLLDADLPDEEEDDVEDFLIRSFSRRFVLKHDNLNRLLCTYSGWQSAQFWGRIRILTKKKAD